jgi:hypothetical protein
LEQYQRQATDLVEAFRSGDPAAMHGARQLHPRLRLDFRTFPGAVDGAKDDTLCHKRGAKVACAGIFLDAVLSSKRHKTFRFGLNWVVVGMAVPLPLRADRYFCLPVLWRLCRKKGQPGHRPRPQLAAEMVRRLAEANPQRTFWLVGDSAYINAALLQGRPNNLHVIGPLH